MNAREQERREAPFSRAAVFALLATGFAAFVAMIYFIGAGDTGPSERGGPAHASAKGLNGYAGLVALLVSEPYEVTRARSADALRDRGLVVLTPPLITDAEEIGKILDDRRYLGPTMLILPKWAAMQPPKEEIERLEMDVPDGWVRLAQPIGAAWAADLPEPFALEHEGEVLAQPPGWRGLSLSGDLPSRSVAYAAAQPERDALVTDDEGRLLAYHLHSNASDEYGNGTEHSVLVVVEPDLLNNYGLADPTRATLALGLVRQANYGEYGPVTFDLTLHGYGNAVNLLTLALRPPFLAATLCLILAMLVVGWRAFLRFGPPSVPRRDIAFGKHQLVENSAGLIIRAGRSALLIEPYIALMKRRGAKALGLKRASGEELDAALARLDPDDERFSRHAERMREASQAPQILRAAGALHTMTGRTRR
jgi:hypothetical protein